MEKMMSSEKLVRMYSEELEYLCGRFGRDHHIYCYDKTYVDDFSFEGIELPTTTTIDLGLILVHITKKLAYSDPHNSAGSRAIMWPEKRKKKSSWKINTQTFHTYHLSLVQSISFYTGVV
tara:strand:+ start:745 stop:1104 length:360 start_codon:yes stop_codon:yes gene_type:complete